MRKGTLHKALGVSRTQGLDLLAETATAGEVVRALPGIGNQLYFTWRKFPPNPSDFDAFNFTRLLEDLSPHYDLIDVLPNSGCN